MLGQGAVSPPHLSLHPIFHSYVTCGLRHECEHLIQYIEAPWKSLQVTAPCPYLGLRGEHTDAIVPPPEEGPGKWPAQALGVGAVFLQSTQWCPLEGVHLALWLPCQWGWV